MSERQVPVLVAKAQALREAFQAGKDEQMLAILMDGELLDDLCEALTGATDRTLTYAAPQIADLAKRVGYLEAENR